VSCVDWLESDPCLRLRMHQFFPWCGLLLLVEDCQIVGDYRRLMSTATLDIHTTETFEVNQWGRTTPTCDSWPWLKVPATWACSGQAQLSGRSSRRS
jgi:hypothetical protein